MNREMRVPLAPFQNKDETTQFRERKEPFGGDLRVVANVQFLQTRALREAFVGDVVVDTQGLEVKESRNASVCNVTVPAEIELGEMNKRPDTSVGNRTITAKREADQVSELAKAFVGHPIEPSAQMKCREIFERPQERAVEGRSVV
jgi:hypothetical protein